MFKKIMIIAAGITAFCISMVVVNEWATDKRVKRAVMLAKVEDAIRRGDKEVK